jgi:hypothetical protein
MTSPELENLARIGKLKREPPALKELQELRKLADIRLHDAERNELAFENRFELAYGAAHALALFALRRLGYRSDNRYLVFQALVHTAGLAPASWRVLDKAHQRRNAVEYRGVLDKDERLLEELLQTTRRLRTAVDKLKMPEQPGA